MMSESQHQVKTRHDVFVSDAFGIVANRRAVDQFRGSDESDWSLDAGNPYPSSSEVRVFPS